LVWGVLRHRLPNVPELYDAIFLNSEDMDKSDAKIIGLVPYKAMYHYIITLSDHAFHF
jgi:hypothetical protein